MREDERLVTVGDHGVERGQQQLELGRARKRPARDQRAVAGRLPQPEQGLQRCHHAAARSQPFDHLAEGGGPDRVIDLSFLVAQLAAQHHVGPRRQLGRDLPLEPAQDEGTDALAQP